MEKKLVSRIRIAKTSLADLHYANAMQCFNLEFIIKLNCPNHVILHVSFMNPTQSHIHVLQDL